MLVNIFDNMIRLLREDKAALNKCSDFYFCQALTLLIIAEFYIFDVNNP